MRVLITNIQGDPELVTHILGIGSGNKSRLSKKVPLNVCLNIHSFPATGICMIVF